MTLESPSEKVTIVIGNQTIHTSRKQLEGLCYAAQTALDYEFGIPKKIADSCVELCRELENAKKHKTKSRCR